MYSYAMTTNAVMLLAWRDRLAMICALPDSLSGSDVVDFGWRFPRPRFLQTIQPNAATWDNQIRSILVTEYLTGSQRRFIADILRHNLILSLARQVPVFSRFENYKSIGRIAKAFYTLLV